MFIMAGLALGLLFLIAIVIDHGLTNIAKAIEQLKDK